MRIQLSIGFGNSLLFLQRIFHFLFLFAAGPKDTPMEFVWEQTYDAKTGKGMPDLWVKPSLQFGSWKCCCSQKILLLPIHYSFCLGSKICEMRCCWTSFDSYFVTLCESFNVLNKRFAVHKFSSLHTCIKNYTKIKANKPTLFLWFV